MSVQKTRTADLSHLYHKGMPHGGKIPAPAFREVLTLEEHGLRCMEMTLPTHVGTHLDAPSHFIKDGATIDQIPLSMLIGPAICIKVNIAADEQIKISDIEAQCHAAQPGDALLIRTGWDNKFTDQSYYHHPYLATETAEWILNRNFRLVGMDVLTPDLPGPLRAPDFNFPVHHLLLGNGVLIMENMSLADVVGERFTLIIGALRIVGGDGSPSRVVAIFDL